jgi:hypothetical protein
VTLFCRRAALQPRGAHGPRTVGVETNHFSPVLRFAPRPCTMDEKMFDFSSSAHFVTSFEFYKPFDLLSCAV